LPTSKSEFFDAVTTPATGGGTVATIRMYGPIDSWGGYWGISTKDIGQVLDSLGEDVETIVLRINSPGGEVFEGVSILNMFRAHKAKVIAVVDGLAASAASVIASGCDEVVMSPGTQMMIHSPWTIMWGAAADLRKEADVLDNIEASLIEIYEAKAGEKDWRTLLADETWMTAKQAVEMGLADRVGVVADAGETSTVSDDDVVIEVDFGDAEDSISRASRVAAAFRNAPKPPRSSEPVETNRKDDLVTYENLTAGLRDRLGITDAAASDDAILAAVDEVLEQATEPTPAASAVIPEGATLIDSAALAELQANAAAGVAALAAQTSARRDGIIASALKDGRITPASQASWRAQLDVDEEGVSALIASMPKNTIPVTEIGGAGDPEASADDALYNRIYKED
jgi:ATP-dependent protease ClpP protease subunit